MRMAEAPESAYWGGEEVLETRATWRAEYLDESGGAREWGSTDGESVEGGGGSGGKGSGAGVGGGEGVSGRGGLGRGMFLGQGGEEGGEEHAL